MRDVALIEKIAGIQSAVAQELVRRAVKVVGPVGGNDVDLRTRAFSVLRAVSILDHGKFADRVNAQQLAAGSSGRVVDFGGAGKFHAVQQKKIFLGAAPGNREHISDDGVRGSDASGALRSVIDDAWIQREQLIVATPIQRQIFYFVFADQAGIV